MSDHSLEQEYQNLEEEIQHKRKRLLEIKRELGQSDVQNYGLHTFDGKSVTLDGLFGDKKDMLLIHNMGKSCSYCTLWADGFNSLVDHLESRTAVVLLSPDSPETQQAFRKERGWNFNMVSAQGSSIIRDLGFENEHDGKTYYMPGVSALSKSADGKIQRVSKDFFGPHDAYCSVWHFFDLLLDGINDWQPQYEY